MITPNYSVTNACIVQNSETKFHSTEVSPLNPFGCWISLILRATSRTRYVPTRKWNWTLRVGWFTSRVPGEMCSEVNFTVRHRRCGVTLSSRFYPRCILLLSIHASNHPRCAHSQPFTNIIAQATPVFVYFSYSICPIHSNP